VGSSVFQVFEGRGTVQVGEQRWRVARGDMFVMPSWVPLCIQADADTHLDLFRFGDAPIFEAIHAHRLQVMDAPDASAG
jgi:gentisate 1,2-dioxygenase